MTSDYVRKPLGDEKELVLVEYKEKPGGKWLRRLELRGPEGEVVATNTITDQHFARYYILEFYSAIEDSVGFEHVKKFLDGVDGPVMNATLDCIVDGLKKR